MRKKLAFINIQYAGWQASVSEGPQGRGLAHAPHLHRQHCCLVYKQMCERHRKAGLAGLHSLKVSKILKLQLAAGLVRSRVRPSHRWRQCRWPLSQMTGPPELWGVWATEGEGAAPDKLTCGLGAVTGSAVLWSLNGDRLDSEATAE